VKLDSKILRFNPAFRVNFGRPGGKNFLAQVGTGLYNVTRNYHYEIGFIIDDDDSQTKFGLNVGAGAGFPLGRAKRMNLMAAYHFIGGEEAFADDFNHLQIRASLGIPL
jgi:opacity protein-like surface antigen